MRFDDTQWAMFEEAADRIYFDDLARFVRAEMPEQTAGFSPLSLRNYLRACAQRCKGFGILSDASIAQFACLSLATDRFIDDAPEVQALLSDAAIPAEERLPMLVLYMDQEG